MLTIHEYLHTILRINFYVGIRSLSSNPVVFSQVLSLKDMNSTSKNTPLSMRLSLGIAGAKDVIFSSNSYSSDSSVFISLMLSNLQSCNEIYLRV